MLVYYSKFHHFIASKTPKNIWCLIIYWRESDKHHPFRLGQNVHVHTEILETSIKILHTSHNNHLVGEYTTHRSFRIHYHSQPHISLSHLIWTSYSSSYQRVSRQNVVIKSNILTKFKGLSFFLFVLKSLNTIFSLNILQFVARLILFDVARVE